MIEDVKESAGATSSPGNVTLPMALRCLDATQGFPPAELYDYYLANTLENALCYDDGQPCRRKERHKAKKGRKAKKKDAEEEAAYVVRFVAATLVAGVCEFPVLKKRRVVALARTLGRNCGACAKTSDL